MSDTTPHGGDGRDSDQVLAELDEEITSWLAQGGMNLMTVMNGQSVSEVIVRSSIWDLLEQDGFGGTEAVGPGQGLPHRKDADSDVDWSGLVATYIDFLSSSLLASNGDGDSTTPLGLDEGHAGGCG
jgi:hypothetical protein